MIQQLRNDLAPYFLSYDAVRDLGSDTAFPVSADITGGLQASDRFFRTDLGWACYYDGARWLTVQEFQMDLTPYGRSAQPYSGGATSLLLGPLRTDRNIAPPAPKPTSMSQRRTTPRTTGSLRSKSAPPPPGPSTPAQTPQELRSTKTLR